MVGEQSFVLFGQPLHFGQSLFAVHGQVQTTRARIATRGKPGDPFAPFQLLQQAGETRAFDAKRLAYRRLRTARIGLDDEQDGILRRTHLRVSSFWMKFWNTQICRRRRKYPR